MTHKEETIFEHSYWETHLKSLISCKSPTPRFSGTTTNCSEAKGSSKSQW